MPTDTKLEKLILNKLTLEQYASIKEPSASELYFVDNEDDGFPSQSSAVANYALLANGDGTTKWGDVALPSVDLSDASGITINPGTTGSTWTVQHFHVYKIGKLNHVDLVIRSTNVSTAGVVSVTLPEAMPQFEYSQWFVGYLFQDTVQQLANQIWVDSGTRKLNFYVKADDGHESRFDVSISYLAD